MEGASETHELLTRPRGSLRRTAGAPPTRPIEGPYVEVECSHLTLDLDQAEAYLGWQATTPWAVVVDRAQLEARLARLREELQTAEVDGPSLAIQPGVGGSITIIDQRAYVRDFRFEQRGSAIIADPRVGLLADGMSLELEAGEAVAGAVPLEIDLALGEVQGAIPTTDFDLPLGSTLTVQQPLILAQRLSTACSLAPDQALLLVTMGRDNSSELLFTTLTARSYAW